MKYVTQADLDNFFMYHAPKGNQSQKYEEIRTKAKEFAQLILQHTPQCEDQSLAIRRLRELVMAVNLTIACNE